MSNPLPQTPTVQGEVPDPALCPVENQAWLTVLGPEPESDFNNLAELAAAICSTPISLVTLMGETVQYHKGSVGCSLPSVPRGDTFCEHTVRQEGIFVVADAQSDPRFRRLALVNREPGIRFYAGVPVYTPSGAKVGALCVIDSVRRELKPWQARALALLAEQVTGRIELRMRRREAELALASAAQTESLFRAFAEALPFPCYLKDKEHRLVFYNRVLAGALGIGEREWLGKTSFDLWSPEIADRIQSAEERVLATGEPSDLQVEMLPTAQTPAIAWTLHQRLCRIPGGEPGVAVLAVETATFK